MNLINEPHMFSKENIAKIEELKNATWVIDMEYNGVMYSVFHQEVIPEDVPGAGHYFGLCHKGDLLSEVMGQPRQLMITNADWIEKLPIVAIEANNGDVIMSHYRHHFHQSPDGSVFIDGGTTYARFGGNVNFAERLRKVTITGPMLKQEADPTHA